ncbi:MAG: transcriptional repressor [Mariniblastus sp.]|nr:transcriptional repressor [Mariniblastus sp.]
MKHQKSDEVSNQSKSMKQAIRDSGLRATPARIATLKLLHGADSPLTHAEVAQELHDLGVDKATVFRNLNDMAAAGLLRKTELGDRAWRFELVSEEDGEHGAHPHFVCVDCGTVSCMDQVKLTAGSMRLSQEFGDVTEILLRGHCKDCG